MVLVRRAAYEMSIGLWHRLFDDAALFPPASESLERAVVSHQAFRDSADAAFVGPFLVPGAALAELSVVLPQGASVFEIALIERNVDAVAARLDEVRRDDRLRVYAVEVAGEPDHAALVLRAVLPPDVLGYVEIPYGATVSADLQPVAKAGLRAKFRTGGTTPEAFPTETELAHAIAECVRADVAFKLTAGLHHALRRCDEGTGFEHHGLLNVVAAIDLARNGGVPGEVAGVLAHQDAASLVRAVEAMGDSHIAEVRRLLASIGTCSIAEPLAELRTLGLLRSLQLPGPPA